MLYFGLCDITLSEVEPFIAHREAFYRRAQVCHIPRNVLYFSQCCKIRLGPKIAKVVTKICLDRAKLSQQKGVMWIYHIPLQGYLKFHDPPTNLELGTSAELSFPASATAVCLGVIQPLWLRHTAPTDREVIFILPFCELLEKRLQFPWLPEPTTQLIFTNEHLGIHPSSHCF